MRPTKVAAAVPDQEIEVMPSFDEVCERGLHGELDDSRTP
jgi:hypothetical protein